MIVKLALLLISQFQYQPSLSIDNAPPVLRLAAATAAIETTYPPCDCSERVQMSMNYYAATNCELRLLVRSAPGGPIPVVDLNQSPPVIHIPAEGGDFHVVVQENGFELKWPSNPNCLYQLEETPEVASGIWSIVGKYQGMPVETALSVPNERDQNRFFRVKAVCE